MTPYTAHLRVGTHEWDVASTDPAEYGPLAGLTFRWGARQDDGWPTQHDPTVLVFGVVVAAGVDFSDVDQGTTVHFTFTPDGYLAPLVEFGGTVRDLVGHPHDRGMVYAITAVDHLQKLREDYAIQAFIPAGSSTALLWTDSLKDADGVGAGEGIRPPLVDPFTGDTLPYTFGSFLGVSDVSFGDPLPEPAWNVLTGLLASGTIKAGATPLYQRGILTYRLDVDGDLDAAQPFEGTWVPQGAANAPLELVAGDDGWTAGGGNLDAALVPTDPTQWSRPRIEPNRAEYTGFLAGTFFERPHAGVTITRYLNDDGPAFLSDVTEPLWVIAGLEAEDQWASGLVVQAARDPELVAGWFTLPTAMRTLVAVHNIDPRHTPDGTGVQLGMLAGAALTIPAGGDWYVAFALRKTLPDHTAAGVGGWATPEAITIDDMATNHPTVTFDSVDPALTINQTLLIGE